jgi:hypothetical protein
MNRLYTPGQLARWEAARLKREALVKPAPISASLPVDIAYAIEKHEHTPDEPAFAQSSPTGVITHQRPQPFDLSGVTLDAEGWSSWIEAPEGGWPGGVCPIPSLEQGEYEVGLADGNIGRVGAAIWWTWAWRSHPGDIVTFRIKARSASDTEGLPVGAVVRAWSPVDKREGKPTYYRWLGGGWSMWMRSPDDPDGAISAGKNTGWIYAPGTVYLPIDVRGA